MHVLFDDDWVGGHLDPTPPAGWVRVHVDRQLALAPVDGLYFVREPGLAMLVAYLRSLGPRRVWRKVRSRRSEQGRNDSWLSVGCGRLDDDASTPVLFVATTGPRGAERVVVPGALVHRLGDGAASGDRWWAAAPRGADLPLPLLASAGWRPEAGPAPELDDDCWTQVAALVEARPAVGRAPEPPSTPVHERTRPAPVGEPRSYTLFGYGQYAKTQVVPNLTGLTLAAVHELDPLQLGPVLEPSEPDPVVWDTSPVLRADEVVRNAVVAGYHHTHATLAADLVDHGARHVVVEKPTASKDDQLDRLLDAMARHPEARVHVAFQRRYSPFNRLLRRDLGDGPISVASVVYEVPLPPLHWYRWPVVGNAVVSNGCHWIDHFLFLNPEGAVVDLGARRLADQVLLWIELDDGATCSISLRHAGSPRLGVRDLCTFWSGDSTAVIEDNAHYRAERGFRRGRPVTCHRYASHEAMYREIARRIEHDLPGDDRRDLERSARTVLDLARLLDDSP